MRILCDHNMLYRHLNYKRKVEKISESSTNTRQDYCKARLNEQPIAFSRVLKNKISKT